MQVAVACTPSLQFGAVSGLRHLVIFALQTVQLGLKQINAVPPLVAEQLQSACFESVLRLQSVNELQSSILTQKGVAEQVLRELVASAKRTRCLAAKQPTVQKARRKFSTYSRTDL